MNSKVHNYGLYIIFGLTCFICISLVFFCGNAVYFNSDTASELVQSIAIKDAASLFPKHRNRGSQFQL